MTRLNRFWRWADDTRFFNWAAVVVCGFGGVILEGTGSDAAWQIGALSVIVAALNLLFALRWLE